MSNHTPKQATPKGLLLKELIGQNTPMSEREWAAAEEIIRLQDQNAALLAALQELKEELFRHAEGNYFRPFLDKAEDAIAKAKGRRT